MADLPDNPNNREEEYLADIAGLPNNVPDNPWSRKEAYLAAISGRLDGIDAKIAALATDISLKGGVADYDHLPDDAAIGDAYITEDTGILYVWVGDEWTPLNMQGGSGVTELTASDYNYPVDSPTYINTYLLDPGYYMIEPGTKVMIYGPSQPTEIEQSMTVMVFTRYNNSSSKWVLSADNTDGIIICSSSNGRFSSYVRDDSTASSSGITYRPLSANQGYLINQRLVESVIRGAGAPTTSTVGKVGTLYEDTTNGKLYQCTAITPGTDPDPDTYTWEEVGAGGGGDIKTLTEADYNYPADNPTSVALWLLPSGIYKVADPAHDQIKISATINNYDSTVQSPLFIVMYGSSRDCSIIGYANSGNGKGRCWTVTVANGIHSAVMNLNMGLQATTGSSNSDVMTQNATTSMVFNDPSSLRQVKIGDSTTSSGQNSVAIGYGAVATSQRSVAIGAGASCVQPNSIAIGYGSAANQQGVMCVGGVLNGGGYNNSDYRVIRGVYDGQDLHDCATLAQGNTLSTSAPTTSTVGVLGQLYTDTTNMHTYQCTAISGNTYTWTQRW